MRTCLVFIVDYVKGFVDYTVVLDDLIVHGIVVGQTVLIAEHSTRVHVGLQLFGTAIRPSEFVVVIVLVIFWIFLDVSVSFGLRFWMESLIWFKLLLVLLFVTLLFTLTIAPFVLLGFVELFMLFVLLLLFPFILFTFVEFCFCIWRLAPVLGLNVLEPVSPSRFWFVAPFEALFFAAAFWFCTYFVLLSCLDFFKLKQIRWYLNMII